MNDPLRPGLQPISQLKAGPTTSSSRSTALPSQRHQPLKRPSASSQSERASPQDEKLDGTNKKATVALIRRVLCPQTSSHGASSPQPLEELLPPLTSSNDVDIQLYAILAIIIREFLYSWYSKITPDQTLVNEIIQVVAHCTRALEQRIREIDAIQLVLDEIPALVEAHIISYRLSKQQSYLSGLSTSHRTLYHELNPHPGLSPVPDPAEPDAVIAQSENEAIYRRLLAHGALAVLLPTEDLENSSLRTIVGDVIADLILGKEIGGRVCEGVFFYEVINKLIVMLRERKSPADSDTTNKTSQNRLEKFGLLPANDESTNLPSYSQSRGTAWIWHVLQAFYLGYVALRFIATGLFRVASNPKQGYSHGVSVSFPVATPEPQKESIASLLSNNVTNKRPILEYRMASMASRLLGISERMPWVSGLLALVQHLTLAGPGQLGDTDGVLDRFIRETIEEHVLTPTLLPNLLLATRSTLFPANARPVSQAAPVLITDAPALTPHSSVKRLTPSGKALTIAAATTAPAPPESKLSGIKATPAAVAGNSAPGKNNAGNSSNQFSTNELASNGSDGVNDHLPTSTLSPRSIISHSMMADTIKPPTASPTGSEKKPSHSAPEIAAIKRRCAANLLSLIPRNIARTFFGAPASSRHDRTCSTTTGSSSPITTTSPPGPYPPTSKQEGGGGDDETTRSSPQKQEKSSPLQSKPLSASTLSGPGPRSVAAGEQVPRTVDQGDDAEIDPDELFLLETIETDLLDLLADDYCNKHLIYSIIETVLVKVIPELAERSVAELMEDRGVVSVPSRL